MTFYTPWSWLLIGVLWPTLPEIGLGLAWLMLIVVMAIAGVMAWRVTQR